MLHHGHGSVKGAVITRPLTDEEVSYLRSHKKVVHQQKIAVDALALIVNPPTLSRYFSKGYRRDNFGRRHPMGSSGGAVQTLSAKSTSLDDQACRTVKYMRDSGDETDAEVYNTRLGCQPNPDVFKAVASNKNLSASSA